MEKNVLQTDLTGKVAVVTGAGGVLCSYLTKVLARAGAKVALVNRSDAAINQYAAEIIEEGSSLQFYPVAGSSLLQVQYPRKRHCTRILCLQAEPETAVQ